MEEFVIKVPILYICSGSKITRANNEILSVVLSHIFNLQLNTAKLILMDFQISFLQNIWHIMILSSDFILKLIHLFYSFCHFVLKAYEPCRLIEPLNLI